MEKRVFATVRIDLEAIDERLRAVIEAKDALDAAVYALEKASGLDGITVALEKPAGTDGLEERKAPAQVREV